MLQWLIKHDFVFTCENFTDKQFNVPGYYVISGKSKAPNRGGVALIIRNYLVDHLLNVDISTEEQIWFTFDFLPNVSFGGVYIAPASSSYYCESDLAAVQSKCITRKTPINIFGGDLNGKFCMKDLQSIVKDRPSCSYVNVNTPKSDKTGTGLTSLCIDCDMVPLNHLKSNEAQFTGGLTYREGKRWISEVDWFICSFEAVSAISSLEIDNSLSVPSDHAPISITINCEPLLSPKVEPLLYRSFQLGSHTVSDKPKSCMPPGVPKKRRQVKSSDVNRNNFVEKINESFPPDFESQDIDSISQQFSDTMYFAAKSSLKPRESDSNRARVSQPSVDEHKRWKRILNTNDDKFLWKAVNWKGDIDFNVNEEATPTDEEFKHHLENLFYPDGEEPLNVDELLADYNTTIPLLDSEITPEEVNHVIFKQVKPNKSSGPDGVSPGLFHMLPAEWLLYLTMLLNIVFFGFYPASWMYAKLIMLFKKGNRLMCDNYRGISVINSITKIYDYVLYNRLSKWWQPDREQAGAQPKRGCTEHLVTLRLLINYSLNKKVKLFIAFIDFSKAYDRVPRKLMIAILKQLGCGLVMLAALVYMYKVTHSILGVAVISAVIGVRQGSPTSCFFFILYVNVLIRKIKLESGPDSFLEWLHLLMLMDDTVIFASSRERLILKLNILDNYCQTHGMQMNESKTKFMVINGSGSDMLPIKLSDITMKICQFYVYLGSIFTADGSTDTSLRAHAKDKKCHLNKLLIFLAKNRDMPFVIKRKVFEAAFNSAILYGAECWLNADLRPMELLYISAVKALLGVRQSTPNKICLVEAGMLPLKALVLQKQKIFLDKMLRERSEMEDDPLMFALKLTENRNPKMNKCINDLKNRVNYADVNTVKHYVANSTTTRFVTYTNINSDMSMHNAYARRYDRYNVIPEVYRLAFTRMRTSSHRLRIETGRWAKLEREQRLCKCRQAVGDEAHVLTQCTLTQSLRDNFYGPVNFPDILYNASLIEDFKFIYDVLKISE